MQTPLRSKLVEFDQNDFKESSEEDQLEFVKGMTGSFKDKMDVKALIRRHNETKAKTCS
jgi:hypothetical protein